MIPSLSALTHTDLSLLKHIMGKPACQTLCAATFFTHLAKRRFCETPNLLCYNLLIADVINPHDAFFKQFLGKPEIAADFLTQHLPAEILAILDLPSLTAQKESFIDEELRQHFSDLLYLVKTTQAQPIYLYLLFEHKSYPAKGVALQLLRYQVRVWEQTRGKVQPLVPIISLVLYHGAEKWTTPANFSALFQWGETGQTLTVLLRPYVPEFSYHLVDLSALSDAEIKGGVWLRVFELLLKHIFDPDLGARLYEILGLLAELAYKSTGMEMLVTMLRYVSRAGTGVSQEELHETALKLFPEDGGVLMKTAAQAWIEEGREEGLKLGLKEGTIRAQRQTILQILQHRFALPAEIKTLLTLQLAQLAEEAQLSQLVDAALQAFTLADFVKRLEQLIVGQAPTPTA